MKLDESGDSHDLHDRWLILEDARREFSPDDVARLGTSKFESSGLTAMQDVSATYWLRLEVSSTDGEYWLLQMEDPDFGLLEVYVDGVLKGTAGTSLPFDYRPLAHKNFVFPLNLEKGSTHVLIVKAQAEVPATFTASIQNNEAFLSYALSEYYFLGAFYGILFIMAMYNLMLYWTTRDRAHLLYVAYVFCSALFAFNEDGLGFQFFWPDGPLLNLLLFYTVPPLLLVSFVFYAKEFMNQGEKRPSFKWVHLGLGLVLFYYIIHRAFQFPGPLWFALFFIPLMLVTALAWRQYRKGQHPMRFFLLGSSAVLVSLVMYFVRLFTQTQASVVEVYIFNFAFVLEAITLSLALGERIKRNREAHAYTQEELIITLKQKDALKDKVNRELEGKVRSRTKALEEKSEALLASNKELEEMRAQLFAMNERLDLANYQLKKKVVAAAESKVKNEGLSFEEFCEAYTSKEACLKFISEAKWSVGFVCVNCGHSENELSLTDFGAKCTKCKHRESATVNTLFHGVKFDLRKAMYIAYVVHSGKPKYSIDGLSQVLDIRRNTGWSFRNKASQRIKTSGADRTFAEFIRGKTT